MDNPSKDGLSEYIKKALEEMWGTKTPEGAKWHVGDKVIIASGPLQEWYGKLDTVVAINWIGGEDMYEYLLEEYPFLIWEEFLLGTVKRRM